MSVSLRGATRRPALALVECNVLASRSKQAVQRLLGHPYEEDEREWSYLLGDEQSAVAIDGEYLTIRFDRGGAVTRVAITS